MKQNAWDVWLGNKVVDTVFHDARDDAAAVKRSLVEHDGYYPEIVVMPQGQVPTYPGGVRPRRVLWSTRYKLQRTGHHCWRHPDTGQWIYMGGKRDTIVCDDWRNHRHQRSATGFLRFIRAFPDQLHNTDLINPFLSGHHPREDREDANTLLFIAHEGMQTAEGNLVYAEVYLLDDERGTNPVFRVFINHEDGWAQIECYDDRYVEAAKMAAAAVEQQYVDEEEAA